jgi:hypothetical protein
MTKMQLLDLQNKLNPNDFLTKLLTHFVTRFKEHQLAFRCCNETPARLFVRTLVLIARLPYHLMQANVRLFHML